MPTSLDQVTLDVKCDDFLKDNRHFYAVKAARKKIAIVRVEVTNRNSSDARLLFGSSKLAAGGKEFDVVSPAVAVRKLSEFTWDFLLFAILDFHSIIALFELFVFLGGPLYNRRLKRKLALLTDGEMLLSPGESKTALLAFRGVRRDLERLTIVCRCGEGGEQQLQFGLSAN
jgi:hypothetical protein